MNIIVTSFYYPNYAELAQKTIYKNLSDYCYKHGYWLKVYALPDPKETDPYKLACMACRKNTEILLELLTDYPHYDYVWHRDCDSIITDMSVTLEGCAGFYKSPPYEIIVGSDKAGVSMGQVLVHNTPTAREYLKAILDAIDAGEEHEQSYMQKNLKPFIAVTPQRWMNSYDCEARLEKDDPGQWQEGDFLVHLAGLNLEQKMSRLDYWMGRVK